MCSGGSLMCRNLFLSLRARKCYFDAALRDDLVQKDCSESCTTNDKAAHPCWRNSVVNQLRTVSSSKVIRLLHVFKSELCWCSMRQRQFGTKASPRLTTTSEECVGHSEEICDATESVQKRLRFPSVEGSILDDGQLECEGQERVKKSKWREVRRKAYTLTELSRHLEEKRVKFARNEDGTFLLTACSLCKTDAGLPNRIGLFAESQCVSCGVSSSTAPILQGETTVSVAAMRATDGLSKDRRRINDLWTKSEPIDAHRLRISDFNCVGLSTESLKDYRVRWVKGGEGLPQLLFPRYQMRRPAEAASDKERTPSSLKVLRLVDRPDGTRVAEPQLIPDIPPLDEADGLSYYPGIFGWHLVDFVHRKILLTRTERDCLAAYSALQDDELAVVTLPFAENLDRRLPAYLADFDHIYIWFPLRFLSSARELAHSISPNRCFVVTSEDRPYDLLLKGNKSHIKALLSMDTVTKRIRSKEQFSTPSDRREDLRNELMGHKSWKDGIAQWHRFDVLNKFFGGFRAGELTILTGSTGFGKTTFICEYAIDLLQEDVRTMFCSFEMPDMKILKWMSIQFHRLPLWQRSYHKDIDIYLDKFERSNRHLIMMNTKEFLGMAPNLIAKELKSNVESNNVQHLIIDNLQFLTGTGSFDQRANSALDIFRIQDIFVSTLRKLATNTGAHVTLVVHPRKEMGDLTINSVSGTARTTQECDNMMVIQRRLVAKSSRSGGDSDNGRGSGDSGGSGRRKFRKFLYILKNRYGQTRVEEDRVEMLFDKNTYTHKLIDLEQDWE